jgi:hypothetical protein
MERCGVEYPFSDLQKKIAQKDLISQALLKPDAAHPNSKFYQIP